MDTISHYRSKAERVHRALTDLSAKRYVYFWADGIYFSARLDHDKQCIVVIIGADELGRKAALFQVNRDGASLLGQRSDDARPQSPAGLALTTRLGAAVRAFFGDYSHADYGRAAQNFN